MSVNETPRVGDLRPSQLLFTYGVGAIVDLPKISVIVTGLDDWPTTPPYVREITEDRLLQAVRYTHPHVQKLLSPPADVDQDHPDPFSRAAQIGVPVAAFPRWMLCPECRLLAPLKSGLFELKTDPYRQDRTAYRHTNCQKVRAGKAPEVVPARFLVACEKGHLDDFPWVAFVHRGQVCADPILRLFELSASGDARDLEVQCETCKKKRRMAEAFGLENRENLPQCRGRRPQLRDFDSEPCENLMRTIILGASNLWFPALQSTIAIPVESGQLTQLIVDDWAKLQTVTSVEVLAAFRAIGQLSGALMKYANADLWTAIETIRKQQAGELPADSAPPDLKTPEWQVLSNYDPALTSKDFRLRPVDPPPKFAHLLKQVVLVERLREVRAMLGFTRLDAVGELTDPNQGILTDLAPLARQAPTWLPANEVRGEGIFIQFEEQKIRAWAAQPAVRARADAFFEGHKKWRKAHFIEDVTGGFPEMRYVLLHTFAHALMRQFALECGYSSASLAERIYAHPGDDDRPPMAGVLLYTAAPDSEGTLGGLVSLGETATLERHLLQAFEAARLCGSDPLCAEHPPSQRGQTLHAAACHACLFAPETACERGNKYLDRSTLVKTVEITDLAFFE
ncbi:MAG: DUF1998 domain-containing protein [Anaerolineales bacterium]|nr:DUF1998 domain-containing protein [Anaerolineales bacterium]